MIIMDMDMAMVDMGIGLTLDIMAIPFSGEDTEDTTEDTIGHIGTSRADTNFRTVS